MGDHAHDYLCDTIDFEHNFADGYLEEDFQEREPHPMFDLGIMSYGAINNGLRNMEVLLHSGMGMEQYSDIQTGLYRPSSVNTSDPTEVRIKDKYKTKYNMMFGMIETLYEGGTLSSKQAKWMETNWKGGTEQLIYEMLDPQKARQILDKFSKICLWINDGA